MCQCIAVDQRLVTHHYYLPITTHTTVPYNTVTTDTTIDRVEFSDITAPYVRPEVESGTARSQA